MKKVLFLASFATLVVCCNNSESKVGTNDSTDAGVHHDSAAGNDHKNAITETMDNMMHAMHNAKPTGNNHVDFAAMMTEHHKGAIAMSKVEVDKGADEELKSFARKVIEDQNKEIAFMQDFTAKAAKTPSTNSEAFQKAMSASMMSMMNDNTTVYNDIDKDYASQMIPHHQSAVDMAKAYLQYEKEPGLTELCRNIIRSQEKEISWLKEWLAKKGK